MSKKTQQKIQSTSFGGGLFEVGTNDLLCCRTVFCPWLTYREIRLNLHGPFQDPCDPAIMYCCLALTGCHICLGAIQRSEIRMKYDLPGNLCQDGCLHLWCHPCALIQEAKEMRMRPIARRIIVKEIERAPVYLHGQFGV